MKSNQEILQGLYDYEMKEADAYFLAAESEEGLMVNIDETLGLKHEQFAKHLTLVAIEMGFELTERFTNRQKEIDQINHEEPHEKLAVE